MQTKRGEVLNMSKKILKIAITVLMGFFMLFLLNTVSNAASFDASVSSTNVKVGDTITVKVTANNAAGMYNVSASNSNVSKVSGDTSEFLENGSATITYKAVSAGTTTITAKASDMTDLDDDTKAVTGNKTFTIKISSNETTSSNNGGGATNSEPKKGTVTSCEIDGIKVKESRNVTNKNSVSVKVVTSTGEGLTIYNNKTKKSYSAKSGKAIDVQIMEGTNTLTITLDSGAKATRKVYSKIQEDTKPNIEEPSQSEPEQPDETQEVVVGLQSLVIKGVTIEDTEVNLPFTPEFSSDVYEYQMLLDSNFFEDYTKLEVEAVGLQEDFVVEITGHEELEDGENVITITVKSADGEKVVTYKVMVTKEAEVMPISAPVEEEPQEEIKPIWNETQQMIIVVFTSVVALMGIIYAIVEYRYSKRNGKDNEGSQIPYSGLDFEKDDDTEKKKKKSKKQQKLEEEAEAENFFEKMAAPKEETINSIIDDKKVEKIDNSNQKDEMPNLDNIFGTNNMNNNIENISKQPRKRGKHF